MSSTRLEWIQQLQAIAQNGLTYSKNVYDIERYGQIQQIAAEIMAAHSTLELNQVLTQFKQEAGYATPKVDVRAAVFYNTEAVAFFAQDQIPELSLTRVVPSQIARLFEHLHHPEEATDFD